MTRGYTWMVPKREDRLKMLVCEAFGVTQDQLFGNARGSKIVDARRVYIFFQHTLLKKSPTTISREMGMNHSSVIWHLKRVEDFIAINDPLKDHINEIELKLKNNS